MKRLKSLILFFAVFSFSCSPKLNKKDYAMPQSDLRPELQTQEEFNQLQLNAENFNLVWNEKVSLFATLNVVSDMLEISQDEKNISIRNSAFAIYQKIMSLNTAVKVPFTETPYMGFFKELSTPEVRSSLKELNTTLILNLAAIKKALAKVKASINWPFKASYKESEQLMLQFLDLFIVELNQLHLSKVVDQELRKQITDEKNQNYLLLNKFYTQIYSEISLKNILSVIENMLLEFDISLDVNSRDKLQRGKGLVKSIESVNDEATAYSAIVEIWFYLDGEERKEYIKQISKAFYYYLKTHSDEDLKCLKNINCDLSIKSKVRDWGIFPQIKKFGIQKIKKELNEKTHAYALSILEENLLKTIKNLDQKVFLKVNKNIQKGQAEIQKINKNTEAFINDRILEWMDKNFDTKRESINGFDHGCVEINLQKKKFTIKEISNFEEDRTVVCDAVRPGAGVRISSRDIGASFRTAVNVWQSGLLDDKQYKRSLLEQINKIMGFGGLPVENGVSKGIVNGLDTSDEIYDVTKSAQSQFSFGVNDQVVLAAPYLAHRNNLVSPQISATSQAELLNGLVHLLDYLKDWEVNRFDLTLGKIKASQIFGNENEADPKKDQIIFPKVQFFGLVVGQLANLVSNLNKQYSQMALLTNEAEKVWVNEFLQNKDKKVLYGIFVDIVNGNRSEEVKLESLYHLIMTLKKLVKSSQGIEKTSFAELKKKDLDSLQCKNPKSIDCKSLAQLMSENLAQLNKIFIPIGNTLATKFRASKEKVGHTLAFSKISSADFRVLTDKYRLVDQLMLIESLSYIYEVTGVESYLWSAKETFYDLQRYYNSKSNFFELDSKEITLPTLLLSIRAFKRIYPHLDSQEQIILADKLKVWQMSLENLKLDQNTP